MAKNSAQYDTRTTHIDTKIVSNIDNGILILDDNLIIYHYNKWLELQTKRKEQDVLGQKIDTIFPTINVKTLTRKIKTALRMGTPTFYTASTSKYLIPISINQIKNSNFSHMQQDVSIIPFDTDKKQVALIITDQTIMAQTHALLQKNIKKVQELNAQLIKEKEHSQRQHEQLLAHSRSAAMGEMISMIAHQWRQPLSLINTIIASLQIKQELHSLTKEMMRESFEKIEKTVFYLSETINDFRDYFKPNKTITEVNLSELFNKSVYFMTNEITQSDIQYTANIDTDIVIQTYKNELLQCIINIIKNSLDAFVENNNDHKQINIRAIKKKNFLLIEIKDNAGGIKKEILNKIFEPYFSTKSKNGTGLGLYMCKTIIHEHLDGKITIKSENNSTTTLMELPYKLKKDKGDNYESSMSTLPKC
jgi:signal transduction histidine kinase